MLTTDPTGNVLHSSVLRAKRRHEKRVKDDPEYKPSDYHVHVKKATDASAAANTAAEHLRSRAHAKAKTAHTTAAKHAPTAKLVNLHTQMALSHHEASRVTTKKYKDDIDKQHKDAKDSEKTQLDIAKTEAEAKKTKAEADKKAASKPAPKAK